MPESNHVRRVQPNHKSERSGGYARSGQNATPSRMAALTALTDVFSNGAYTGEALTRAFRRQPSISPVDKALATEITYGTIGKYRMLDYSLAKYIRRAPDVAVRNILRMSAYQMLYLSRIPDNAICDEAVKLTRAAGLESATGFVNGVLRGMARDKANATAIELEPSAHKLGILSSLPDFVCQALIDQYGYEPAESILTYSGRRYTTVYPMRSAIGNFEFESELNKLNCEYEKSPIDGLYRIYGLQNIESNELYRRGQIAIQGEGAHLCARVVDARPGMRILDACAAPGGKSIAMADAMQGSGRIIACDIRRHRVELIRAACRRLNIDNIKPLEYDATKFNSDWSGTMDAVLCDVPCSGLGVLDAKPDIRLRLTNQELTELPQLQADILNNCARYVARGGTLVYSTCTILKSENQDIVKSFLAEHPNFEQADISAYIPASLQGAISDKSLALLGCRDGTEGFFISKLIRVK